MIASKSLRFWMPILNSEAFGCLPGRHPRTPPLDSPTDQTTILESVKMGEMGKMGKNGGKWVDMEKNGGEWGEMGK